MRGFGKMNEVAPSARDGVLMRRIYWWALVACLSISIAGWNLPVRAQTTGASSVTSPIPGSPGSSTPAPKSKDEELGIPVGSFRLYPTMDIKAGYDSNVFAQPGGQGSAYEAFRPSLSLQSDWSNHMLNFDAYGVLGFYNSATSQNYQNFGVSTDGRLDIQQDWYLTGNAAFIRNTEALGAPGTATVNTLQSPTVVYTLPVGLSMYQRFNRLFYQASVGVTPYRYENFGQTGGNVLPDSSRNRTEFGENLRAGYELYDGVDFWVQGGLNQRVYQEYTNVANQQRDSTGWQVTGGATVDLGGISKLEGFVGYAQQTYFNPGVSTPALIFGLGGVWNGYQPLTVRPFVLRSVNETAFSTYQNYVSTSFGFELSYIVQEGLTLNAGGSWALLDYTPVPGTTGTFQHTDNFYRASLGLMYSIRPELAIGPLYEFAAGNGPDPTTSPNYNRHIIMLKLVVKR